MKRSVNGNILSRLTFDHWYLGNGMFGGVAGGVVASHLATEAEVEVFTHLAVNARPDDKRLALVTLVPEEQTQTSTTSLSNFHTCSLK